MKDELNQLIKTNKVYSYVRFSTNKQRKSNSLERQNELVTNFCSKYNLTLETLEFQDLGVSGYSGRNIKTGMLSQFKSLI